MPTVSLVDPIEFVRLDPPARQPRRDTQPTRSVRRLLHVLASLVAT